MKVAGNLKFDWSPPASEPEIVARLREAIASEGLTPVIVAGSTVEDEEAVKRLVHKHCGHDDVPGDLRIKVLTRIQEVRATTEITELPGE